MWPEPLDLLYIRTDIVFLAELLYIYFICLLSLKMYISTAVFSMKMVVLILSIRALAALGM